MLRLSARASLLTAIALLAACSSDPEKDHDHDDGTGGDGSSSPASATSGSGGAPLSEGCTTPTEVICSDDVIQQMSFMDEPAPGFITSTAEGAGWVSLIDATAGGSAFEVDESYVYAKFTDAGLEKVALSDEASLESMDWDIAFRRYVMRINSGFSGPSCVHAGRVPGSATFDELSSLPENVNFRSDETFTATMDPTTGETTCDLIPDASGLPASPATALSGYWTYPGCVQMTGHTYAIELASGRRLKLTVTHYYNEAAQEQCATQGSVPMSNNGSANFRIRWAFL